MNTNHVMSEQEKQEFFDKFNRQLHILGKFMMILSLGALVAFSFIVGAIYDVMPDSASFLMGILNVGIIYYPVAIVEFLVYTPMLGVGGSYLAFLTGNLTNLKIPCAMSARELTGVKPGTPENEIVSTISIASSAIVTMLVLAVGVLLIAPLQPVLSSPVLEPAFNNVTAALFGAFGIKYYIKSPKIAAVPFVVMTALCIFVPAALGITSILIVPAGLIAIGTGYMLDKKSLLGEL